ncbi:MAG: nitrilase-related carbon-nitrogen hydrolase, partial [Planctomycetota bacterium]
MRIALAQRNAHIGNFAANAIGLEAAWRQAKQGGADLVITPELSVTGYPPRDLLEVRAFVDGAKQTVERLARLTQDGPALLVGFPERIPDPLGNALFNA